MTDMRTVNDFLDTSLLYQLRQLSALLTRHYNASFQDLPLTSWQLTMLLVLYSKQNIRITDLADMLTLTTSTVLRNVDLLMRGGYVKKVPAKDYRHRNSPALTPKAIQFITTHLPTLQQAEAKVGEVLGVGHDFAFELAEMRRVLVEHFAESAENTAKKPKTKLYRFARTDI